MKGKLFVKTFSRRETTAAARTSGGRRGRNFAVAATIAAVGALSFSVSALATAPAGVNGPGFVTTPDTTPAGYTQPSGYNAPSNDGLGVAPGAIKHVWVIVMENHAYETNFSGMSNNDYTAKALPEAGALLTHYYGTGHSSLDNYLSMTSGQAPVTDDQNDCSTGYANMSGTVDTTGSLASNGNYGQFKSAAGPNAPAGDNGCVYPATVPTIFNQLDAAKKTWKVYAQDVDNVTGGTATNGESVATTGQDAGVSSCGAPDATVGNTPQAGQSANPGNAVVGSASGTAPTGDSYVAKHNPLGWYQSVLGSGDCNSSHLAPLFGTNDQLHADLKSDKSTPAFSYIVPNNCNDGHDAMCKSNNLSGEAPNAPTNAPEGTPINEVGGTYAQDITLEHIVPEIMSSPAYSDGGLIAIVWDEAYPQFTYSGDSFVDSTVSTATAFNSVTNDSAGETLFGRSLNWEPSGPNTPNVQSQVGQQMSSGPGFDEYLGRPGVQSSETTPAPLVSCGAGTATNGFTTLPSGACYDGAAFAENVAGTKTVSATAGGVVSSPAGAAGSSLFAPNSEGETVTLGAGVTGSDIDGASGSAGPFYIGQVSSTGPAAVAGGDHTASSDLTAADQNPTSSFQLVDSQGNPVTLSGTLTSFSITVGGPSAATDPLYDAYDPTTGGGDSGAILLSPYIKGGTVSNTYYNHYSLLRSIEDIFDVRQGSKTASGYTGSIALNAGVDGNGHLGYAGQPGLAPFGTDVFAQATHTVTKTVRVYVRPPRRHGHTRRWFR
jgi:Phosphoesterase family